MRKQNTHRRVSSLLPLLLFALFAVGILSVLLGGTQVFRTVSRRDELSFSHRTAARYVTSRVQQAEHPRCVTVEEFGGIAALTVRQELGGIALLTRVYCHEGWLRELYCPEGVQLDPADGEKLLPMEEMTLSQAEGLLTVTFTPPEGESRTLLLSLNGGEVAAP